jgi:ADP-ribose pyrophosphatase YjhB (NUDIX family)
MKDDPIAWAQRLSALSQSGINFTTSDFEKDRYEQIQEIAHQMMSAALTIDQKEFDKAMTSELGYVTPKVGVRGAVFKEDKVLLVKEKMDGNWAMPGGWADVGISPADNVVKEIKEESGIDARPTKLIAVYDRNKRVHGPRLPIHIYKLIFLCEMTGGELTASIETDAADFFSLDDLPPLSLLRTTPEQIQRAYEHNLNPNLATDFD